jgi:hypothetical protein
MVCTEVPNQIKFVPRPHPTGSRTDFMYIQALRLQYVPEPIRLDKCQLCEDIPWLELSSYQLIDHEACQPLLAPLLNLSTSILAIFKQCLVTFIFHPVKMGSKQAGVQYLKKSTLKRPFNRYRYLIGR